MKLQREREYYIFHSMRGVKEANKVDREYVHVTTPCFLFYITSLKSLECLKPTLNLAIISVKLLCLIKCQRVSCSFFMFLSNCKGMENKGERGGGGGRRRRRRRIENEGWGEGEMSSDSVAPLVDLSGLATLEECGLCLG